MKEKVYSGINNEDNDCDYFNHDCCRTVLHCVSCLLRLNWGWDGSAVRFKAWVSILILEISVFKFVARTWPRQAHQSTFCIWPLLATFPRLFGQSQNLNSQDCLHFKNLTESTAELVWDFVRMKSKSMIKIILRTKHCREISTRTQPKSVWKTRMHSSRMRTVRSSGRISGGCTWSQVGGVPGPGVCTWSQGVYLVLRVYLA